MSHSLPAAWPRTARRCTLPPAPGLVWSEVESKKSIFLRPAFRSLSPGPGTGVGEVVFPGRAGHMCGVMCSLYICMDLCIKTWECPHTYLLLVELEMNLRENESFTIMLKILLVESAYYSTFTSKTLCLIGVNPL